MVARIRLLARSLCTAAQEGVSGSISAARFNVLAAPLRTEARSIVEAVEQARSATKIAAAEGSDDIERKDAFRLAKLAVERYVRLVARGNPPIQLSPHASHVVGFDGSDEEAGKEKGQSEKESIVQSDPSQQMEKENDVMKLLGEDIQVMKDEIFQSNKQRIWIGWRGWF